MQSLINAISCNEWSLKKSRSEVCKISDWGMLRYMWQPFWKEMVPGNSFSAVQNFIYKVLSCWAVCWISKGTNVSAWGYLWTWGIIHPWLGSQWSLRGAHPHISLAPILRVREHGRIHSHTSEGLSLDNSLDFGIKSLMTDKMTDCFLGWFIWMTSSSAN